MCKIGNTYGIRIFRMLCVLLFCSVPYVVFCRSRYYNERRENRMLLTYYFYGMYINSQDFSCLLENRPFLPKTLAVFWKIGLFYQKRRRYAKKTD